ncbi:MAG: TolC family protein, partial [Candidatus Zixiibacteriota bacterium]
EENVAAAREDMSLIQEKYNLGAATILELLDAQVSLITAQNNKVEVDFDYNLSIARLENAMGVR